MEAIDNQAAPESVDTMVRCVPEFAAMVQVDAIVTRLADGVACTLAAESMSSANDNIVRRAALYADDFRVISGGATAWATGERLSIDAAAFRNGVAIRYLDYNDTFVGRGIVHPSDLAPALVALAEGHGIGWELFLQSLAVAYEVLCRLAETAEMGPRGFDPSTLTPLATAAGAAWLLRLDAGQTKVALQLAALDAAALRCIRVGELSEWKAVASARGAVKGLFATRMAQLGTKAPRGVFEGEMSLTARVTGPLAFADDSRPRTEAVQLKLYPSQIFIQPLCELAREIRPKLVGSPSDISAVLLRVPQKAVRIVGTPLDAAHPPNRESADHSAAFCVAAMLTRGRLGYREFDATLSDPATLSLAARVRTVAFDGADSDKSSIEVSCADGTILTARRSGADAMGEAALADKFDDLWPRCTPRTWPWSLAGAAPAFPSVLAMRGQTSLMGDPA